MAPNIKEDAISALQSRKLNGKGLRIGICVTQWNKAIMESLLSGAQTELESQGVSSDDIIIETVPGAYELPYAASRLILSANVDAVICLGCLIKGATMHFEYISEAVSLGISRLNLTTDVPVLFGVLTCMTEEQALYRAGLGDDPKSHNHGIEWAQSAIEMALLRKRTAKKTCCPFPLPVSNNINFAKVHAAIAATALFAAGIYFHCKNH